MFIYRLGVLTALFGCHMAGSTLSYCSLGAFCVYCSAKGGGGGRGSVALHIAGSSHLIMCTYTWRSRNRMYDGCSWTQHHPAALDVEEADRDGCQLNRRSVALLFPNRHVRISNSTSEVLSNEIRTNTGDPQGCVPSPALFTLYTSDCRCGAEGLSTSKVFR